MKRRHFLAGLGVAAAASRTSASPVLRSAGDGARGFDLTFADGRLTRLRHAGDAYETDYLAPGLSLGGIALAVRRSGRAWQDVQTDALGDGTASQPGAGRWDRVATLALDGMPALRIVTEFALVRDELIWSVTLENQLAEPLEIGDLALPLPMNGHFTDKRPLTSFVLKHSFVSGAGSFFYWMRANSVGPYLMMTPDEGTSFEYWDHHPEAPYRAFVHSRAEQEAVAEHGGTWRLPATSLTLAPHGSAGSSARKAVRFGWVADHAGVRDRLAQRGLLDIDVTPGMTVPTGWDVTIAVRSTHPLAAIEAEHGGDTRIEALGRRGERQLYRIRFARLGENRLALRQESGGTTWLEFFVTEAIETLIAKRGAFIARHQHRDPAQWYYGLLAEWNAETGVMLGPDNYDRIKGWRIYEVTCDDPGLSKPAFLASKNAEYPVQQEVDALDLYIDHFVWGGLQRTTEEHYPFAIYGIPDWKTNRNSPDDGPKGKLHIWRPYDYPHIVCLYFAMWRIARDHPQIRTRLAADAYLDRAAGTAIAMFTVPKEVAHWSAYETGFYNECVIPDLIDALNQAGRAGPAAVLRGHWERKVDFFLHGKPNLFGSEYAFDSTGFESTQAIASYALAHAGRGGALAVTQDEARRFADAQMAANIFCRGSIEPAYYLLGSDYRSNGGDAYTLTYMAQMGGWAVLDYALHMARQPAALLRLGYQSYLSSWALVNSGTAASNHGYWFPGEAHDGAAGGGFEPASYGKTWLDQPHHRGSWYYSCEIDLGFCGALRGAATILADDPIFGRVCLGGTSEEHAGGQHVMLRDGVRRRFHARLDGRSLDLVLRNDRFAADEPLVIGAHDLRFTIESANPAGHVAELAHAGLPAGAYRLIRDDGASSDVAVNAGEGRIGLPLGAGAEQRRFVLRRA